MTDKILPCPFCGCEDIDEAEWMDNTGASGPACPDCGAMATLDVWNKRAWQAAQSEQSAPAPTAAMRLLDDVIHAMEEGFVRCGTCGDQEDTKDLDFMSDLVELRAMLSAQAVAVVGEPTKELAALAYQRAFAEGEAGGDFSLRIARHVVELLKPTHSIPAAELERLREKLASAERELETERMRLAACGVIALANTVESAKNARDMLPEYWSASAQDCASAVDREMDYRTRLAQAELELERLRKCEDALKQMLWIVHDSSGVAGYHLNGAIAEWESFPEYHAALTAIAAEGEK